jgi:hypothetical protein
MDVTWVERMVAWRDTLWVDMSVWRDVDTEVDVW